MGVATVGVGLLPTYETARLLAPVLLAAKHAPPGRRALYAAIPQAGPSLGSCCPAR